MKRFLLGAALLTIAMSCLAETKQAVTLHMESGEKIVYYLDDQPSIKFEGQNMVVTVDNKSTDIPMQDVNRWEIGTAEYSGAENISNQNPARIAVYGSEVTVYNPESNDIAVYSVAGQKIGEGKTPEVSFTLPKGIYLITVANNTYKIAIR